MKGHHDSKGRLVQMFCRLLLVCTRHRWITVGVTVAAFALALFGIKFVQQQFFPSSDRAELVIDWNLPQNASITETNAQIVRFEGAAITRRQCSTRSSWLMSEPEALVGGLSWGFTASAPLPYSRPSDCGARLAWRTTP